MTRIVDHYPVLDYFQDVFETPELSINIVFADVHCDSRHVRRGRWSPIANATRPPTKRGTVTVTNTSKKRRNRHGKKED